MLVKQSGLSPLPHEGSVFLNLQRKRSQCSGLWVKLIIHEVKVHVLPPLQAGNLHNTSQQPVFAMLFASGIFSSFAHLQQK